MQEKLALVQSLWEPEGRGAKVQYAREKFPDMFHEDAGTFVPGTWCAGGQHRGRPAILKMFEAIRRVWPVHSVFHELNYWVGDDTVCMEWYSTNQNFRREKLRNSGMTIWRFRGDKVIHWQEITDSEYFEEAHGGWREIVGPEIGQHLARYAQTSPPWYPDPAANEWALDDCTSDGRRVAPAHMRASVEAALAWWANPRKGDESLFADDLHIYFQGRSWPLGGHHHGREGLARVMQGARLIWPEPQEIVRTNVWANDDRVLVQWFTRGRTWKGQACRNSGWTVWKFRSGKVVDWRAYTDTSFYAELLTGWREHFGETFGAQLPNWQIPEGARYPRLDEHE
jgi:ketosteroid isomerase-like protein